jgi:hypothetical protein
MQNYCVVYERFLEKKLGHKEISLSRLHFSLPVIFSKCAIPIRLSSPWLHNLAADSVIK